MCNITIRTFPNYSTSVTTSSSNSSISINSSIYTISMVIIKGRTMYITIISNPEYCTCRSISNIVGEIGTSNITIITYPIYSTTINMSNIVGDITVYNITVASSCNTVNCTTITSSSSVVSNGTKFETSIIIDLTITGIS